MLSSLTSNQVASVVSRVLALLASGVAPWRKPWAVGAAGPFNPLARVDGKKGHAFTGVNAWVATVSGVGLSRFWATPKQWMAEGVTIKGAKSIPMLFPKFAYGKTKADKRLIGFGSYVVINASDLEHHPGNATKIARIIAPFDAPTSEFQPIERAERLLESIRPNVAPISCDGESAYYALLTDSIVVPRPDTFTAPAEFYSTVFHEAIHSTGHGARLARPTLLTLPTLHTYTEEELVAEMGACFLSSQAGIEPATIENSAAYLAGWISRIKDDPTMVTRAIEAAFHAYRWTTGEHPKQKDPK